MGFKVDIVELNNLPNLKTTNVKISDYSGIGTKVQKVVIVEGTNINLSSNNEAIQAAIEAKASAAEAKVTLANAVQKTGAQTMAGPLTIEGVLTTNSQIVVNDPTATYGQRLVTAGSVGYLQSGKLDRDVTDQKLMLSGWYGTDLSYLRFKLASGTNPQVAWGSSIHDVLHRGNMPTAEEVKAMAVYDRPTGDDCNNAIMPGNYGIFANTANTPHGTGPSGSTLLVTRWGNGASTQIFFTYSADRVFVRRQYIGVWQDWFELYSTKNKQPVGGMGLGVGDSPNALTITGNVRDFNLAKTNGNFTIEGSWANGVNNTVNAEGHAGILQVSQRAFDNCTVQKYTTWLTGQGVNHHREFTRIWINDTEGWNNWLPSGSWETVNTYRNGILRLNNQTNDDSVYPYVSYTKEKYRDTIAAGTPYTIGEIGFRAGSANRYDPHTGDQLARIIGQTYNTATAGEYEGGLFLASRYRNGSTGLTSDTSTLVINRGVGSEFTHAGKKVQINTGNVTADNFYQNTAQDTVSNALTRVDYVKGLVLGSLSSTIPLNDADDLDNIKTAGFYSQPANVKATVANHYPVQKAGNLVVTVSAGTIQKYWVYNSSEVWSRAQYTTTPWTPWVRDYNEAFKPTAADVGTLTTAQINTALGLKSDTTYVNSEILKQVSKTGDTMTGNLTTPKVLLSAVQGTEVNAVTRRDFVVAELAKQVSRTGDTMTGALTTTQVIATSNYAFVSNLSNTHGMYLGNTASDKRLILGGGDTSTGSIEIRPQGVSTETGKTVFNTNGTITNGTNPTAAGHLTNKVYVDGLIAQQVSKSGDTMTGPLVVQNASNFPVTIQSTTVGVTNILALRATDSAGTQRWYVGQGASNSADVLLYSNANNTYVRLEDTQVSFNKNPVSLVSQGTIGASLVRKDYLDSLLAGQTPNNAINVGGSANLNNYQTPGFYYQDSNANATSGSNYPTAQAGSLVVLKTAGIIQEYTVHATAVRYIRAFYNNAWSTWKVIS